MPCSASLHRPRRGRQLVAVVGRPQQTPAEAHREVLTPVCQGAGVQACEGVFVGHILVSQNDFKSSLLFV